MKRTMFTALLALAFGLGLTLIYSTESMALHKGSGGLLACGGCHTMHNSQGSSSLGGNPSIVLLRGNVNSRGDMQNFCLQCHASNGSQNTTAFNGTATAPKVYISGAAGKGNAAANTDPFNFQNIGAGGDFSAVGNFDGTSFTLAAGDTGAGFSPSLGYGHSVGIASATPPGGMSGLAISGFTCTSCHDPHGRTSTQGNGSNINVYRNLKYNITIEGAAMSNGMDGMFSWVGGINGGNFAGTNPTLSTHIWPIYNGSTQNVYNAAAASGTQASGREFNNWCAQCHGQWHESIQTSNKGTTDWTRHPVGVRLNGAAGGTTAGFGASGAGVTIVDYGWYAASGLTSAAAPNTTTTGTKLPAMQFESMATGGIYYFADTSSDQVFCLSCHYAHGGPNYDALRWQHNSAVSSGAQTGVGIVSNVGCQQCHNR